MMREQLEDEILSPCAAVGPAKHALAAYAACRSEAMALRLWSDDEAFNWEGPFGRSLEERVPLSDIGMQMARLAGVLAGMMMRVNHATGDLLRTRDTRRVVTGQVAGPSGDISVSSVSMLVTTRRQDFHSERQKIVELRETIRDLAMQLERAADHGQNNLQQASLDGQAYRPEVVLGELSTLTYLISSGLMTCAVLARMAAAPTGHQRAS